MNKSIIPKRFPGETAIVAGTGPSLTPESIALCNEARRSGDVRIFVANRAHELFDADVLHACNSAFYPLWWGSIAGKPCDKWTTTLGTQSIPAAPPGTISEDVKYINVRWDKGLSQDPSYICAHHGTGPMLVNIAYLYGCTRLLLIGWDMRYPGKINNSEYSQPRRYLGEDKLTRLGWPKTGPNGERPVLIREMQTIHPADYGIDIINCTPGSALKHFPMRPLAECL